MPSRIASSPAWAARGCAWRPTPRSRRSKSSGTPSPAAELLQEAATYEEVSRQEVMIDHVFWEDFLYSPCRTWKERRWVARRVYMDQDALVKRFGEEKGKRITAGLQPAHVHGHQAATSRRTTCCRRRSSTRSGIARTARCCGCRMGYPELLDEVDDPLQLEDFEPCPKPLFALTTTSNCIAANDFVICQDQYNELDLVNNRISLLVQACKVVGVYDAAGHGRAAHAAAGQREHADPRGQLGDVRREGWRQGQRRLAAAGRGDRRRWRQLRQAREDIKGQIYELTGISDIVRGNTKASRDPRCAETSRRSSPASASRSCRTRWPASRRTSCGSRARSSAGTSCPQQILKLANMEFYPDMQGPAADQGRGRAAEGRPRGVRVARQGAGRHACAMTDYASRSRRRWSS